MNGKASSPLSSEPEYTPSGVALPALLRRSPGALSPSSSIEGQLAATVQAWKTLQAQIQRGEDCYVEESGIHNIYKGWEGYMDSRVTEAMPKRYDHRWFSSRLSPLPPAVPYPAVSPSRKVEKIVVKDDEKAESPGTKRKRDQE